MAIFRVNFQVIKRKPKSGPTKRKGGTRSVVAAAAYRSGERLRDTARGIEQDYSKTDRVLSSEIYLPEGAKPEFQDRATLWNAVEAAERRGDAQLAREVTLALPAELKLKENKKLVESYVKEQFISKGMIADVNIHTCPKGDKRNIHAHVLLSTREVGPEGFGLKNRDWNDKNLVLESRELWAERVNQQLEKNNAICNNIDHRSYSDQLAQAKREKETNLFKLARVSSVPQPNKPMVLIQRERQGLKSELSEWYSNKVRDDEYISLVVKSAELNRKARRQFLENAEKDKKLDLLYNKSQEKKKENIKPELKMVNKKLVQKPLKEMTLFDDKPALKKPNEIKPVVLTSSDSKKKINIPQKKEPVYILDKARNSRQEQKIIYNDLLNQRDYKIQQAIKKETWEQEKKAGSVEAQIKKEFEPEKRKLAEKIYSIEKEMKNPLFFMKSQERKQALSVGLRQSEAMKKAIQAQIKSKKEYCQELRDPEKIKEIAKSKVLEENPTLARQIDQVRSIGLEHEKQERAEKREHSKNKGRDFSRGIER